MVDFHILPIYFIHQKSDINQNFWDDIMQNNSKFWNALDDLIANSEIIIDRPKGTAHP